MTITSTTSRWEATGNGSTTVFPYNNKIFADTDLKVYLGGTLQTLTTHYTVSGAGAEGGGNVTFVTAPANGVSVVIVRSVANTQLIDYPAAGAFPSVVTEDGLDRRTVISQQHAGTLSRSIQYLESDANLPSGILPSLDTIKGRYLRFNSSTGAPEAGVFDTGTTSRVIDQLAGDGATTSFTLSTGVGVSGTTLDVYVTGVHQDPDTYTASGTSLTFTEAPPAPQGGDATNIVVVIWETVPIGETTADLVSYTPSDGGGATTVQARLRQISLKEFGAGNTTANMGVGFSAISGNKMLIRSADPDISTDSGISATVQIQRIARYGASATVNPKALRVYYQVNDGAEVAALPWSISGEIENSSTSNTSGEGGTAVSGVASKNASGTGVMFGGHFQVKDQTDGVTGGGIVGIELNIQANGADTNSNRIGLDLIARTWAGGTSPGDFTAGLRVRNTASGDGTWLKGISVEDTTSTRKMPLALAIDTSPGSGGIAVQDTGAKDIGISLGSTYADAAIKMVSTAAYQIRTTAAAVSSTADIILAANSATGIILNGTYTTGNAIRLTAGQALAWEATGVIKTYYDSGSSQIRLAASASDRMAFEIDPSPRILLNGTQVLRERITGWTVMTGTAARGALATYTAPTISGTYSQSEVQAIADHVEALSQRIKAMQDDNTTHGFYGA